MFIAIKIIHRRNFRTLNYAEQFRVAEVLEGILVWGILVLIGVVINEQKHFSYFLNNRINSSLLYVVPVAIISIGVQAYTEEVVFRGYLLQSLSLKIRNYSLLMLICSSVFGILHAAYGLEAIFGVMLFGCLDCYIVLKRESLAFVSGAHFINNFIFVYMLEGGSEDDKDFFDFDYTVIFITLVQFALLFLYVRLKDKQK